MVDMPVVLFIDVDSSHVCTVSDLLLQVVRSHRKFTICDDVYSTLEQYAMTYTTRCDDNIQRRARRSVHHGEAVVITVLAVSAKLFTNK